MDKIVITGGRQLKGEAAVRGSKTPALPILIASLLTDEPCTFEGVPELVDIKTALKLLKGLGVKVEEEKSGTVTLQARGVDKREAPYELVKTMRASFLVLGPLVARFGEALVSTPGG